MGIAALHSSWSAGSTSTNGPTESTASFTGGAGCSTSGSLAGWLALGGLLVAFSRKRRPQSGGPAESRTD